MTNYRTGTPEENATHSHATAHLVKKLSKHKNELKQLLRADLAEAYALCYWDNVGCYWCTEDGVHWDCVKCIT